MLIHGDRNTLIRLYRDKVDLLCRFIQGKKTRYLFESNDFVLLCWFILTETLEFSDYILLLCRFMEIEKLEFDSTVMKFFLLSWFRAIETLESYSTVMVLYYYAGLWR